MTTKNLGLIKAIFVGSTPPSNTNVIWRDTNVNKLKYYNVTVPGWIAMDAGSVTAIWGNITGNIADQLDLKAALDNLQDQINTINTSIVDLQNSISSIENDISTIQDDIADLQDTSHVQGTDQTLDAGGPNEVNALGIKSFIDSKGQLNGLASLDGSGKILLAQLPDSILGALQYQAVWNASTNTPTLTSGVGTKGYFYIVSVAGNTIIDGNGAWRVGDWILYNGTAWEQVRNSDKVSTVNGQSGVVVLTTTHINEGTRLYYTEARVDANANVAANTAARHNRNQDQFTIPNIANETQLRSIVTVGRPVGSHIIYKDDVANVLRAYKLVAGTDVDNSPNVIRPGDFNIMTNAFVWKLAPIGGGIGDMLKAVYDPNDDGIVNAAVDSKYSKFLTQAVTDAVGFKAIPTVGVNLTVGSSYALFREASTNLLRVYHLESGTTVESYPSILRPNDYAATTNEKIWVLAELPAGATPEIKFAASDRTTPITIGMNIMSTMATSDMVVTEVVGYLSTPQVSGALFTVDIKVNGVSILSTLMTFENGDNLTITAVPAVISNPNISKYDIVSIDVTQVGGDDTAAGLQIFLL